MRRFAGPTLAAILLFLVTAAPTWAFVFGCGGQCIWVTQTDGTNTMPTMDVAARAGFLKVTDGTNTLPTGDVTARRIWVQPSDGTTDASFTVLTTNLTFTSPASASTVAGTPVTGLGKYRSLTITCTCQGATGGTLDIYVQFSPDGGTTWVDYAHFPQFAAAAAATTKVWTVTKLAQQTTLTTVGTGTSPALAANTIVGGDWGDRLRTVAVAGASTSAGAAQTILLALTP